MRINAQKLANLATALTASADARQNDNTVRVLKFRDARGQFCALELKVNPVSHNETIDDLFNCEDKNVDSLV